jgi:hypothetical protein
LVGEMFLHFILQIESFKIQIQFEFK